MALFFQTLKTFQENSECFSSQKKKNFTYCWSGWKFRRVFSTWLWKSLPKTKLPDSLFPTKLYQTSTKKLELFLILKNTFRTKESLSGCFWTSIFKLKTNSKKIIFTRNWTQRAGLQRARLEKRLKNFIFLRSFWQPLAYTSLIWKSFFCSTLLKRRQIKASRWILFNSFDFWKIAK